MRLDLDGGLCKEFKRKWEMKFWGDADFFGVWRGDRNMKMEREKSGAGEQCGWMGRIGK